jgi:hypothetical protein
LPAALPLILKYHLFLSAGRGVMKKQIFIGGRLIHVEPLKT